MTGPARASWLAAIALVLPLGTQAAAETLEITEIYYDAPGSDTAHEWLELTNQTAAPITIAGGSGAGSWRLFDTANHTLTLIDGSATVAPGQSVVIAQDPVVFRADYPNYAGTLWKSALSLPNSQATLKLSTDKGQTWFHERSYTAGSGGAGDGRTLTWNGTDFVPSSDLGGTPGQHRPPSPPAAPAATPPFSRSWPVPTGSPAAPIQGEHLEPSPPASLPAVHLQLSEVAFDPPGRDEDHEWFELRVLSSTPLDLTASALAQTRLRIGDDRHRVTLVRGEPTSRAGDYLVVAANADQFLIDYPDFRGTLLDSAFSLPNSGSAVAWSTDGGLSWLMDEIYQPADRGMRDAYPLERTELLAWSAGSNPRGTPGQPPALQPPVGYPTLLINEFLPRPAGGNEEWIELYNADEIPISLAGWTIDDAAGGSKAYTFPETNVPTLPPAGYWVVTKAQLGLVLGNTSDEVRLRAPDGQLVMTIPYGDAPVGVVWMRDPAGLGHWSTSATPGQPNELRPVVDLRPLTQGQRRPAATRSRASAQPATNPRRSIEPAATNPRRARFAGRQHRPATPPAAAFPAWTKGLPWGMLAGIFLGVTHLSLQKGRRGLADRYDQSPY